MVSESLRVRLIATEDDGSLIGLRGDVASVLVLEIFASESAGATVERRLFRAMMRQAAITPTKTAVLEDVSEHYC